MRGRRARSRGCRQTLLEEARVDGAHLLGEVLGLPALAALGQREALVLGHADELESEREVVDETEHAFAVHQRVLDERERVEDAVLRRAVDGASLRDAQRRVGDQAQELLQVREEIDARRVVVVLGRPRGAASRHRSTSAKHHRPAGQLDAEVREREVGHRAEAEVPARTEFRPSTRTGREERPERRAA